MQKVRQTPFFESLFSVYNSALLRRNFRDVFVSEELFALSPAQSHLLLLNHVSWWDGLILFQIARRFPKGRLHVLMKEDGLSRYPLFRRLGAYSVAQDSPSDVRQMMRYTLELLAEKGNVVCWFPQGRQRHESVRPLGFQRGIGALCSEALKRFDSIEIRAVGLHYTTFEHKKAEVYAAASANLRSDLERIQGTTTDIARACDDALVRLLDKQVSEVSQAFDTGAWPPDGYQSLFYHKRERGAHG